MPRILVVRDDGRVEQQFADVSLRGGEWHALALDIQRATRRAAEEGAGDGKVLVPMTDFVGPAFTLLMRATATSNLCDAMADIITGTVQHYNSVLDSDIKNWKRAELYKFINDWKIEIVVAISQALQKYAPEEMEDSVNGDTPD